VEGEALMSESLKIGFRIEFWDDGKPGLAVVWEDAFLATALPRVGELVSSGIVAGIVPPWWLPVADDHEIRLWSTFWGAVTACGRCRASWLAWADEDELIAVL
jgi:hypothetical protein